MPRPPFLLRPYLPWIVVDQADEQTRARATDIIDTLLWAHRVERINRDERDASLFVLLTELAHHQDDSKRREHLTYVLDRVHRVSPLDVPTRSFENLAKRTME